VNVAGNPTVDRETVQPKPPPSTLDLDPQRAFGLITREFKFFVPSQPLIGSELENRCDAGIVFCA
jgi:hypothetical protein